MSEHALDPVRGPGAMEKRNPMAASGKPTTGSDQSLGDLVALATKDLSQLVRYEIDLAKSELRGDIRRAAISGALFGIAAFFGVGILVALFFAYAYLLHEVAKAPGGMAAAFALTGATVLLVAGVTALVAWRVIRRMSGMKRTRASVTEGIGLLRREAKGGKDGVEGKAGRGRKALRRAKTDRELSPVASTGDAGAAARVEPAESSRADGQRTETADPRPPR
ncbi:MAG TPA: phage holin family protein [Streptosporangiaceae bacterium]|nr:phage holin family protein [Streptosporangiaceae bacterium]